MSEHNSDNPAGIREVRSASAAPDGDRILGALLSEARRIMSAQAGSLFIRRRDLLHLSVTQYDTVGPAATVRKLLTQHASRAGNSIAGHAVATGKTVNIPDVRAVSRGVGLGYNSTFDEATGFRTGSVLAVPLEHPDGRCVGVLELINHVGADGRVGPFPSDRDGMLALLTSSAAATIDGIVVKGTLLQTQLDTIARLSAAAELRDSNTAGHIRRLSGTAAILAEPFDTKLSLMIRRVAPLHDLGKLGIPNTILDKRGVLTAEERCIVQTHTEIGARILENPTSPLMQMAHDVALRHHERWDGKGYPHELKGDRIPLAARIVALADVFDALVSWRCYQESVPVAKAVSIIRDEECGRAFDPDVVNVFLDRQDPILATYREIPPQTVHRAA